REHLPQRLLEALGQVVEVIGDSAQQVAARLLDDVTQWQDVELVLRHLAQAEHQSLYDTGNRVGRDDLEERRREVEQDRFHEHAVELPEVDALVGDHTFEDDVGAMAEDAWPEDIEEGAEDRGDEDDAEDEPLRPEEAAEPDHGGAEVL